MTRRPSFPRDRDYEDAPRGPARRRAKRRGGSGTAVILIVVLGGLLLLGAVGVVAAVLLLKSGGTGAEKLAPRDPKTELADRFVGSWEGGAPERPSLKVYLDVTRDRITLQAFNTRTNDWGDKPFVTTWRASRAEGDSRLIIVQEVTDGSGRAPYESVIDFTSKDSMSMTSSNTGRLIANFRRAGKR